MGLFGWVPFGGSVAGLALFISASSFVVGRLWGASRTGLSIVSVVAAAVCVVLARNWPDRAAAIAIAVASVDMLRRERSQGNELPPSTDGV